VIPLQLSVFGLVVLAGTATVLARDPARQVIVSGVFGLALILLFTILQAPDVALSAVVVAVVALPAMLLLALAQIGARTRAGSGKAENQKE
jgi:energy-converting hydrogenase B subunit D